MTISERMPAPPMSTAPPCVDRNPASPTWGAPLPLVRTPEGLWYLAGGDAAIGQVHAVAVLRARLLAAGVHLPARIVAGLGPLRASTMGHQIPVVHDPWRVWAARFSAEPGDLLRVARDGTVTRRWPTAALDLRHTWTQRAIVATLMGRPRPVEVENRMRRPLAQTG